jgi:hypothetical protein
MNSTPPPPNAAVTSVVAYVHVMNVQRSLDFYGLLGLQQRSQHRVGGELVWADACNGQARIMFAKANPEPDPTQQAVLFYMYCADVRALRNHLLAAGVHDGGAFAGKPGPNEGRAVAFEVTTPFYMPGGELRLHDPDGYVILVGSVDTATA